MSDPLASALARLAPAVDVGASRELFERSRDDAAGVEPPRRVRDRALLAAACALLVVGGVAAMWAISGSDEPSPVGGASLDAPADGTEFRLIALEPVGDADRRAIRAAGSVDALAELLDGHRDGFQRFAGELDERNEIAVVIERPDNSCPPDVERFTPVDGAWRVAWSEEPDGTCEDVGLGWVYVLAVRRDALDGVTEFVLPADQHGQLSWDELRVAVPGAPVTSPDAERPPVPGPEELQVRLVRFPVANDLDPDEVRQLIAAHGRGDDWTGTLTAVAFHDVPAGEWWLCWEILESSPVQCGARVRLAAAPAAYLARPEDFEEQTAAESDEVVVVVSRGALRVTGTWFDDAAVFVEGR